MAEPMLAPPQASRTPAASDPTRLATAHPAAPPRVSASESTAQVEYVVYAPMRPISAPAASQSGQRLPTSRP